MRKGYSKTLMSSCGTLAPLKIHRNFLPFLNIFKKLKMLDYNRSLSCEFYQQIYILRRRLIECHPPHRVNYPQLPPRIPTKKEALNFLLTLAPLKLDRNCLPFFQFFPHHCGQQIRKSNPAIDTKPWSNRTCPAYPCLVSSGAFSRFPRSASSTLSFHFASRSLAPSFSPPRRRPPPRPLSLSAATFLTGTFFPRQAAPRTPFAIVFPYSAHLAPRSSRRLIFLVIVSLFPPPIS